MNRSERIQAGQEAPPPGPGPRSTSSAPAPPARTLRSMTRAAAAGTLAPGSSARPEWGIPTGQGARQPGALLPGSLPKPQGAPPPRPVARPPCAPRPGPGSKPQGAPPPQPGARPLNAPQTRPGARQIGAPTQGSSALPRVGPVRRQGSPPTAPTPKRKDVGATPPQPGTTSSSSQGSKWISFRSRVMSAEKLESIDKYHERHIPPCHADVACIRCEATPYIGPPPTCEWHIPLCHRSDGCPLCDAAPPEARGPPPNPLGSPLGHGWAVTPPRSPSLPLTSPTDVSATPQQQPVTKGVREVGDLPSTSRLSSMQVGASTMDRGSIPEVVQPLSERTGPLKMTEAQRKAAARAAESPAQREARLRKDREYHARNKITETEEQREQRLRANRDCQARKQAAETDERKEQRLQANRDCQSRRRTGNLPISAEGHDSLKGRRERLQKRREYEHQLHGEPVKERGMQMGRTAKLGYVVRTDDLPNIRENNRIWKKEQRARETLEERNRRLEKDRVYQAERRANKATKIPAKVKEATKERIATLKASRTDHNSPWDGRAQDPKMWRKDCAKEWHTKVTSGMWKGKGDAETGSKFEMDPSDPDNLHWHCPAGGYCQCQFPQKCPKCLRSFYGCSASCPHPTCDWKRPGPAEEKAHTTDRHYMLNYEDEVLERAKAKREPGYPGWTIKPVCDQHGHPKCKVCQ